MTYAAIFTDAFDEPVEIEQLLTYLMDYSVKEGLKLDIFRAGKRDGVQECGSVCLFDVKVETQGAALLDLLSQRRLGSDFLTDKVAAKPYTVVHAVTAGPMALNGLIVAWQKKLPILASHHPNLPESLIHELEALAAAVLSSSPSPAAAALRLWQYLQWFYNQSNGVLVPSLMTRRQFESRLNVPVALLTPGVDTVLYHPDKRKPSGVCHVLYVGPVSREKNLNVLAELLRGRDDCRLVIVGQGAYLAQMRVLCPSAVCYEHPDETALAEIYASADMFVSPSTTDVSSDAFLKALASGLPVVLTNKTSQHELIHDGRDGFVIGTTDHLRQRLDQLIQDAALRKSLGHAARQTALCHAWPDVCQMLFDIYQQNLKATVQEKFDP